MNNLILINYDNPERPTVSGRELHEFLQVDSNYTTWFKRMTEYGFTEGEDYVPILENRSDGLAGKPRTDHQLTIPMAKELCMIQRNDRGKQARQYFLAIESQWNSPEAVMRRAVLIAQAQNDKLKVANQQLLSENARLAPKALFADAVSVSDHCILISELAKLLKQNGIETGQNRLFEQLRTDGFLVKDKKRSDFNMPTQKAMELGLFKVRESTRVHSDGHTSIDRTTKVTGKGQVYLINYYLKKQKTA